MNKKIEKTIGQVISEIEELKHIFKTLELFTDEIFDDVICLSEPNVEFYINKFKKNKLKAFAVMDYSDKARELFKKMDAETQPIYDYLVKKERENNGRTEE